MSTEVPTFDEGLQQLEAVVQRLEGGSLGLEEALEAYESGVQLSQLLLRQLSEAQRRVDALKRTLDGDYRAEPWEGEAP